MATPARQPKVPKILRIGIVRDDKLVQSRLIRHGESVTMGGSAKNTFVVPNGGLPREEYPLFVAGRSGYVLNFTDRMKGRISSGGAVVRLDKLRNDPSVERQQDSWRLPLTELDRGKIELDGDISVLFQFVPPPPESTVKPMKSMDFRPRLLEEDDPVFLGFLALFTALAAILLVWVWNTEPPKTRSLDEIPDRFTKLVLNPPEKKPPEDELVDKDKASKDRPKPEPKKTKAESEQKGEGKNPKTAVEKAKAREELKQDVMQRSLMLRYLTTRGENAKGDYAEDLLSENDSSLDDLDAAVQGVKGVEAATSGDKQNLRKGAGGSKEDVDIGSLGGVGGGSAKLDKGPDVKVQGTVDVGEPADLANGGDAASVKTVVKQNSGQLQYCYEQQLKVDPNLGGRVEIEWNVRSGRVTSASVFANTTGNKEFADCIIMKVRRWHFPDSVEGDILYPFIFKRKN